MGKLGGLGKPSKRGNNWIAADCTCGFFKTSPNILIASPARFPCSPGDSIAACAGRFRRADWIRRSLRYRRWRASIRKMVPENLPRKRYAIFLSSLKKPATAMSPPPVNIEVGVRYPRNVATQCCNLQNNSIISGEIKQASISAGEASLPTQPLTQAKKPKTYHVHPPRNGATCNSRQYNSRQG